MYKRNLRCSLFGHKLELSQKHHIHIKEYCCRRCNSEFTEDGYGQIVRLDKYWRQTNNRFKAYLDKTYS